MAALPDALALATIPDGSPIVAADHRNNYAAVQAALNALIALLGGGIAGQVLTSAGAGAAEYDDAATGGGTVTPAGAVSMYVGAAAPTGWLLCDGSAFSRTTYATLFAVIGTAYGAGDGSTTFNVPDLRGRAPFGVNASDAAAKVTSLGANDGATLSLRGPSHHHAPVNAQNVGVDGAGWARQAGGVRANDMVTSGGGPQDTPAFLALNFIVKT